MHIERESIAHVFLVSAAVAVVCSLAVSTAVTYFRSVQSGSATLDWQRSLVYAAGMAEPSAGLTDSEVSARYRQLSLRYVDLQKDLLSERTADVPLDWHPALLADDETERVPQAQDIARIGQRPRFMPVYFVGDPRAPERILLPVYGQGMWSTLWAIVAYEPERGIILSLVIHEHAETPGIGDRIEDEAWLVTWKDRPAALAGQIDTLSGATVTTQSVVRLVMFWLGEQGYGPYLGQLRATPEI